jgi:methylenetetrahydrofolate reductase (NADPH)
VSFSKDFSNNLSSSQTNKVKNSFKDSVLKKQFLITAEVSPPRGCDPAQMIEQGILLRGRVHALNITDSSRAVLGMSPLAASVILQYQVGITTIYQLACRDRNAIALQGDLLGASALGLSNVLALTGDPVKAGDHPQAKSVFDLESVRLLQAIAKLNQGVDINDKPLSDRATDLFAGAAIDPQSPSWSGLQKRFERKLAAGAEFFQSQLITDFELLDKFMDKLGRDCQKPILAGIFLLKSAKNAQFINKYVPGVNIPDHIINRLAQAEIPLQEGIAIAAEQVKAAQQICHGVHLMAVKTEHLIPQILDLAGIPPII